MTDLPPPPDAMPPPPPSMGAVPPPGYQPYQQYQAAPQYAGFGARLGAVIIDGLIAFPFAIPGIVALFAGPKTLRDCTVNGIDGICNGPSNGAIVIAILLYVVGIIAYFIIYCRMVSRGQSWGHKATGIRIVDQQTGQSISAGRVVGRQFARILSGFLCYLGYFWMLWDQRKQTWHDKIVGTVVVKS
jgi:uncharacterized RDD family membrane protein YckC